MSDLGIFQIFLWEAKSYPIACAYAEADAGPMKPTGLCWWPLVELSNPWTSPTMRAE